MSKESKLNRLHADLMHVLQNEEIGDIVLVLGKIMGQSAIAEFRECEECGEGEDVMMTDIIAQLCGTINHEAHATAIQFIYDERPQRFEKERAYFSFMAQTYVEEKKGEVDQSDKRRVGSAN